MNEIVLASASERRRQLLEKIHLSFRIQPSSADETYTPGLAPSDIVQELALRKAEKVAQKLKQALVIGADTIVVFEDKILEKPATPEQARQMLRNLSDNTHQVYTGVALYQVSETDNDQKPVTFTEVTQVTFGVIEPAQIDAYVSGGSPMDKAGAYGIQDDFGALFVKKIEGDYYNVVGFPLFSFYKTLSSFAPKYLQQLEL